MTTLLSIILPVYNVTPYLKRCLDSLVRIPLERSEYEIIAINDGSTDDSEEILKAYAQSHPEVEIRLYSHSNRGLGPTRNRGIDLAKGEYVWFVDSDDWIDPEVVPGLIKQIEEEQSDLIRFLFDIVPASDYDGPQILNTRNERLQKKSYSGEDFFLHFFNPDECYSCWTLFRRTFLTQNNLCFYKEKMLFEDIPFTVAVLSSAAKVSFAPTVGYYYYIRKNSLVRESSLEMPRLQSRLQVCALLLKQAHEVQRISLKRRITQIASAHYRFVMRFAATHCSRDEIVELRKLAENLRLYPEVSRYISFPTKILVLLSQHSFALYQCVCKRLLPKLG